MCHIILLHFYRSYNDANEINQPDPTDNEDTAFDLDDLDFVLGRGEPMTPGDRNCLAIDRSDKKLKSLDCDSHTTVLCMRGE